MYVSVYTWYILPWSFLVNCLPIKRMLEKIILRVSVLECSATKRTTGTKRKLTWINSQMQSNLLWSFSYKPKILFLLFLCPFFNLYSPFSFPRRGKTVKKKTAATARVPTYLHSNQSQLPLQWRHYCFPQKCVILSSRNQNLTPELLDLAAYSFIFFFLQ